MLTSDYMYIYIHPSKYSCKKTAVQKLLPASSMLDIIFISYLFIKVNFHILPKPTAVNVA